METGFFINFYLFLLIFQISVVIAAGLCWSLYYFPSLRKMRMLVPAFCFFGGLGVGGSSLLLSKWSIFWLLDLLTASPMRLYLLAWWSFLTLFSIGFTSWAQRFVG